MKNGERGIRTPGARLELTPLPRVHLRPLGHLSRNVLMKDRREGDSNPRYHKAAQRISNPSPSTSRTSLPAISFYCYVAKRIRTSDLQIRNLMLYPAELWLQACLLKFRRHKKRRGGDSNPRYRYQYNSLAGSPIQPLSHLSRETDVRLLIRRRERDSNPRRLAPQWFSRPPPSTARTSLQSGFSL